MWLIDRSPATDKDGHYSHRLLTAARDAHPIRQTRLNTLQLVIRVTYFKITFKKRLICAVFFPNDCLLHMRLLVLTLRCKRFSFCKKYFVLWAICFFCLLLQLFVKCN